MYGLCESIKIRLKSVKRNKYLKKKYIELQIEKNNKPKKTNYKQITWNVKLMIKFKSSYIIESDQSNTKFTNCK